MADHPHVLLSGVLHHSVQASISSSNGMMGIEGKGSHPSRGTARISPPAKAQFWMAVSWRRARGAAYTTNREWMASMLTDTGL